MTRRFTKNVDIVTKNGEDRTATGVVLTPFELDRQLDWLRPEGVRNLFTENPGDGVMHAAFPEGHAELDRNEVLDEPETIDGEEFEAGEWVIRRRYQDENRWQLVKSGVLSSFSIGGEVTEAIEYETIGDLPDTVEISPDVDPESIPQEHHPPMQIVDGSVDEISDVDVGAVPSADHAVVKSLGKNAIEDAPDEESFIQVMGERNPNASEDELRALWDYLQSAEKAYKQELPSAVEECKESIQEDNPDMSDSMAIAICRDQLGMAADKSKSDERADTRVGDSFENDEMTDKDSSPSGDSAEQSVENVDDATLGARIKRVLFGAEPADDADGAEDQTHGAEETEKVGRTLSNVNIREAKAVRDHATRILASAGVDEPSGMYRTYDKDEKDDFSLSSFAKTADSEKQHETETDMNEKLIETVDDLADKVDTLTEKLDESEEDDGGDETEKADSEPNNQTDELIEKIDAISEKVDGLEDRVDKVAKSSADTDQATGVEKNGEGGGLDDLAKLLG